MSHKILSNHQVQFPQVKGPTNLDFPKLTFKSKFGILLFSPPFSIHHKLIPYLLARSPITTSFNLRSPHQLCEETNTKNCQTQIQTKLCPTNPKKSRCLANPALHLHQLCETNPRSELSVDLRFPDFCGMWILVNCLEETCERLVSLVFLKCAHKDNESLLQADALNLKITFCLFL